MRVAIMQPYFMPYIGYFQLINSVDKFVIYDNIEYTKKGWINRNRILLENKDEYITLPLKKDSDYLCVKDRYLADSHLIDKEKLKRKIHAAYKKAPYYKEIEPLWDSIQNYSSTNLFEYILHSLQKTLEYLNINTEIIVSSTININHSLKNQEKVIEICRSLNATSYINSIGGTELYHAKEFGNHNIALSFLKPMNIEYNQFNNIFIPWLSIIDVLMFNSPETIQQLLKQCEIQTAQ